MKTTKILTIAAMALMISACSSNDIEQTAQQPDNKAEGIPFTATISIGESATTRALTESGSAIVPSWAAGEKVALIHNDVINEMTVQSVSNGVATISGTITGSPANDDHVTIIYPSSAADGTTGNVKADLLAAQDGTLATIAEKYDVRKGAGTLNVGATATLYGNVSLTNQFAIFKFTIQDLGGTDKDATEFKVSDNSGNVITTVTPGSATGTLYVALPVMAAGTYWFNATIDGQPYIYKATTSAATTAGTYYQSTVKMATLGNVIASDGKFYVNNAATPSGNTGVAMIAYLGNGSECTNGLAIQLNDSPVQKNWNDAKTYASGFTAVPSGTWRLPSKADWLNMILACAVSGDDTDTSKNRMEPIAGFKAKIAATGTTWQSGIYWSSTAFRTAGSAWCVSVYLNDSMAFADFGGLGTDLTGRVLGCLAF